MLNKFSIGTKLVVGFVLVILLLVVVGISGYYSLTQVKSALDNVTNQLTITQDLSGSTDEIYLARVASANHSGTKDISYSNDVSASVKAAIEFAKKAQDNMTNPENQKRIDEVVEHATQYEKYDNEYKEFQITIDANTEEQKKIYQVIIEELEKVADVFIHTYETMEKDGKPLTTTHVRNYGVAYELLELIEFIRCSYRDLVIALQNPKNEEGKNKAIKEIADKFTKFTSDADELQKTLATKEAKALVADLGPHMTRWAELISQTVALNVEQAKTLNGKTDIAKNLTKEVEVLNTGVKETVEKIKQESASLVTQSLTIIVGFVIFAAIVGLVCAFVLTSNITSGIKVTVATMGKVAKEGDLTVEVDPELAKRGDEIGLLIQGLQAVMNDYHGVDAMANSLAGGNWRVNVKEKGSLDTMNQNLGKMLDQVNQTLNEINESVKQVATGAGEVSSASQTLSSGAQESAASLEEITASMSEISSQTKSNAENAGQAREIAQKATSAASEGQTAMSQMTEAMQRITKNSEEIQRVIKVIDDIAFQTNLLALNAAVEAARAGSHGKGFAVVAEEVRNLAARSAKAAKETSDLISTSGREIEAGGETTAHTAQVLNTIVEQIKQTTDLVAGIAVASNEQAQGVAQVTIGLQQIDSVTQQNTAAAEECASAANEMSGMATNLQALVAKFQLR